MLNKVAWPTSTKEADPQVASHEEPTIDLIATFRALRRRWVLIASIFVLAMSGAVLYLAVTPSHYTASSMLIFDVRKIEPFQHQGNSNMAADSAFVDSQVEVLRSDNIARSVITKLNLLSDPEFAPPPQGGLLATIQFVKKMLAPRKSSPQPDQLARVVRKFQANLTIKRIGLTYVVNIAYRSLDANKAASISNAVTEAYIVGELESKYQAGRRANIWLQDRINELQTMAQSTERAVAEYKAKTNVGQTGTSELNEQELAAAASQRRVVLQELETSAKTYRALHESLLQRIAEFTQQQSFPASEARVVSAASAPLEKSDPKSLLVLAAASLLGLVGGLGAAFAREYLDTALYSPDQVEKRLGVDCLGILPTINPVLAVAKKLRRPWWRPQYQQAEVKTGDRVISTAVGSLRFVVDKPFSLFGETIRSLNVAVDVTDPSVRNKVVGVTSVLAGEGKSLVAANLSEMIAISGRKVLLIDADLRNRGLTRQLTPTAEAGLMQVLARRAAVEELVWRDPQTNLNFLPMGSPIGQANHPTVVPPPAAMQGLLTAVRDRYDYVILDLPPIAPVADVKAASHLIDYFVLVIEWGRTSREAVADALNTAPLVGEKLLGAVLNKADATRSKQYVSYQQGREGRSGQLAA